MRDALPKLCTETQAEGSGPTPGNWIQPDDTWRRVGRSKWQPVSCQRPRFYATVPPSRLDALSPSAARRIHASLAALPRSRLNRPKPSLPVLSDISTVRLFYSRSACHSDMLRGADCSSQMIPVPAGGGRGVRGRSRTADVIELIVSGFEPTLRSRKSADVAFCIFYIQFCAGTVQFKTIWSIIIVQKLTSINRLVSNKFESQLTSSTICVVWITTTCGIAIAHQNRT